MTTTTWRHLVATIAVVAALVLPVAPASATEAGDTSLTGQARDLAYRCLGTLQWGIGSIYLPYYNDFINQCALSDAPNTAGSLAGDEAADIAANVTAARLTMETVAEGGVVGQTIQGVLTAVAVEATQTYARVAATTSGWTSYAEWQAAQIAQYCTNPTAHPLAWCTETLPGLGIAPVSTGGGGSSPNSDATTNLKMRAFVDLEYDCDQACGSNSFVLYKADADGNSRDDLDFWSLSVESSVSSGHMKQIEATMDGTTDDVEMMSASPRSIDHYGSAGSTTISAAFNSGGMNFGISKTWNISEGQSGGARDHKHHRVMWKHEPSNDYERACGMNGTKALDGINVWKAPKGAKVSYDIGATVWLGNPRPGVC
jgi:hypothetical protein